MEVQGLRDELLSISNTRDATGNSLFAGGNTEVVAFQTQDDGSVLYHGDARQTLVNVSDERQLGKNRNGLDVFSSTDRAVPGTPQRSVYPSQTLHTFWCFSGPIGWHNKTLR